MLPQLCALVWAADNPPIGMQVAHALQSPWRPPVEGHNSRRFSIGSAKTAIHRGCVRTCWLERRGEESAGVEGYAHACNAEISGWTPRMAITRFRL